jgi:CRP-like cAMP-binding protein
VGDGKAGQVEHITWRAVKIRTFDNEYIIYPNSVVSKERVTNFSLPTPVQALRISVGTSYDDPPDVVKAAIREVLAGVPGVLADPAPSIYTTAYADFSVNYEIKFYVGDYGPHRPIQDQVMTRLWYGFRRRGIEIPFPIRHVFHHGAGAPVEPAGITDQASGAVAAPEAKAPANAAVGLDGVLAAVPIFEGLSREDLRCISGGAVGIEFAEGERVIAQGEAGSALYAIVRGTARVALRGSDGTERDVAALKRGDVFGEMSLLTGDPRTASVYATSHLSVAEVGKEALAPVLAEREGLAARMAELMILRKEGLDRTRASGPMDAARRAEMAASSHTLLGRICAFFGIRG